MPFLLFISYFATFYVHLTPFCFWFAFKQIQFNPLFYLVTICITLSVEVNALWGGGRGRRIG